MRTINDDMKPELSERQNIEKILRNLEHLEVNDFPAADIDTDRIKSLLGNLYMELLFPHNDRDMFFSLEENANRPLFDKRA